MTALYPMVILAGGLATRLHPLTEKLPKSLIPIQDEPFIYHQLRLLQQNGFQEVILLLGFLAEEVISAVQKKVWDLKFKYHLDGEQLLGTGGALKNAYSMLPDKFFIMYGDSFLKCDFSLILKSYQLQNKLALMTVFRNENRWDRSNILYQDGEIVRYDKKMPDPAMNYIDYGVGILDKKALHTVSLKTFDLAMLYQRLLAREQLAAYEVNERFYEIGSFAGMKELEYYLTTLS